MSKTIHTLVNDIYRLMETKEAEESVDVEAEIEKFGENMKSLMRTEFGRTRIRDSRTLRLSNIGRDDRVLWNLSMVLRRKLYNLLLTLSLCTVT